MLSSQRGSLSHRFTLKTPSMISRYHCCCAIAKYMTFVIIQIFKEEIPPETQFSDFSDETSVNTNLFTLFFSVFAVSIYKICKQYLNNTLNATSIFLNYIIYPITTKLNFLQGLRSRKIQHSAFVPAESYEYSLYYLHSYQHSLFNSIIITNYAPFIAS